jgi:hypothetical protein
MNATATPTSLITSLTKNLHWAERAFFILLLIGAVLAYSKIDAGVLNISLGGLAVTFFLYAYKPLQIVRNEGELLGFSDLLATTILPKVLWISSAISTLGLLFYLLNLGNEGYKQMLLIGGSTIGIGLVLVAVFSAIGLKNIKIVSPVLLRAVPLLIFDFYILFK